LGDKYQAEPVEI